MRIPKNYIIFYSINLYKSNIFSIKKKDEFPTFMQI